MKLAVDLSHPKESAPSKLKRDADRCVLEYAVDLGFGKTTKSSFELRATARAGELPLARVCKGRE